MASEEDSDEINVPKKSKLPMILGIVGALVLGGAGGFGASTVLAKKGEGGGEPAHGEEAAAEAGGHGEKAEAGGHGEEAEHTPSGNERVILDLGQITVNLRGGGGGHMLRMEIHVETTAAYQPNIEKRSPELRDSIITAASDYAYADLEGVDGKTRLRDELLSRMNGILEPERIERVYFNSFIMQ